MKGFILTTLQYQKVTRSVASPSWYVMRVCNHIVSFIARRYRDDENTLFFPSPNLNAWQREQSTNWIRDRIILAAVYFCAESTHTAENDVNGNKQKIKLIDYQFRCIASTKKEVISHDILFFFFCWFLSWRWDSSPLQVIVFLSRNRESDSALLPNR